MSLSLQVYADVGPLLERVDQSQRQALRAMSVAWQGCDLNRLSDAALRKTLKGLLERVYPGSDSFRLSSSLYRQTYQVTRCSLLAVLVLLASVMQLGCQLLVHGLCSPKFAPALTGSDMLMD